MPTGTKRHPYGRTTHEEYKGQTRNTEEGLHLPPRVPKNLRRRNGSKDRGDRGQGPEEGRGRAENGREDVGYGTDSPSPSIDVRVCKKFLGR